LRYQPPLNQGQQKLICDTFGPVRAFEIKLELFRIQLENVSLCHFSSCDFLHKVESVNVLFPGSRAVEMIDSMAGNFKMRVSDLRSHATNIRSFEHSLSFEVSDVPEKLLLELIELQYDAILRCSFN
jgi:hypothetical protein